MDAKEQDQLANFLQGFAKQLREMALHGSQVSGGNSLELGDMRLQLRFEVESLAEATCELGLASYRGSSKSGRLGRARASRRGRSRQ